MFKKNCNLEVYIWGNDPLMQRYNVGNYEVKGYIMPYEMYDDLQMISRDHDIYFGFSDVLDAFIDALLCGSGQSVSTDCSMFLQMEAIDGD